MTQKRFQEDLGLLATLLGGGLDPMSGISMLQQAITDKRARQDQRKASLSALIQGGVENAATMTKDQSDEYLQTMGEALGLKDKGIDKATESLSGFYPENYGGASIMQALWDETDEAEVARYVQEAWEHDGAEDDFEGVKEYVIARMEQDGISPDVIDLVKDDIETSVHTNWTALGGRGENSNMSLEEATARTTGTFDPETPYGRTGDPDDDITWMPDVIEGPLNFATFNAADNLLSADDWGDVGQGIAGLGAGVGSLFAAPVRAAAGVGQIGKLAAGAGRIGGRATAVRSALAAGGDDAISGWARLGKQINPISASARGLQRGAQGVAALGRGYSHVPGLSGLVNRVPGVAAGRFAQAPYQQWASGAVRGPTGKLMGASAIPAGQTAVPYAAAPTGIQSLIAPGSEAALLALLAQLGIE